MIFENPIIVAVWVIKVKVLNDMVCE